MKPTPFDTDLDTLNLTYAQKRLIKQFVAVHIIGEDEPLDIQSDFDKLDVPYMEADKYSGLDGVRQASRNLLRNRERLALYGIKGEQDG